MSKDISNQKFGKLIAIEPTDIRKNGSIVWKCKCECGNICYVRRDMLVDKVISSCGCIKKQYSFKNVKGEKFGKLTVIEKMDERKNGNIIWKCLCDCGNECYVPARYLFSGHTKSCGCLLKESNGKHLMTNTRLFRVWTHMKTRCYNKNNKDYQRYGKRGICICDAWLNDFKVFYNWATNNGYADDLYIDRIDNNGNYEPNNCRWVNMTIQSNNRRSNVIIIYKNIEYTQAELCKKYNINKGNIIRWRKQKLNLNDKIDEFLYLRGKKNV